MEWIDFNAQDFESALEKLAGLMSEEPRIESPPPPAPTPPPSAEQLERALQRWSRAAAESSVTGSAPLA